MTRAVARHGRPRRRSPVATVVAALPLALVGCGVVGGAQPTSTTTGTTGTSTTASSTTSSSTTSSSSTSVAAGQSVGEIFSAARSTAMAAQSGRVVGSVTDEGEKVSIDLAGTVDGANQRLRLTTADGTLTVHTVAGKYYLVADKAYWTKNAGATAAEQLAGKYVLMSQEDASSFGAFTLRALLEEMFSDSELSPLDAVRTDVDPTTVKGEQLYVLTDRRSDTGRVVVTADGKAELRSISVGGANPGSLVFSQWNAVPPVPAPPAKDVVKL
jgi:hypothetical protein